MTMRALRRLAANLVVALAVATPVAALAALAPPSPAVQSCAAAGSHQAGLVLQHGDGTVVTRCVSFAADTITAEQALAQSGIAWSKQTFGGFGVAVCAIDGEPTHYLECPDKDRYWAFFVSRGAAAWQLSPVGVSAVELRDGDLAGFRYVPVAGVPDPPALPGGVCAAPTTTAPSPTPVAAVTASVSAAPSGSASATPGAAAPTVELPASPAATWAPSPAAPPAAAPPAPPSGPDPGLLAAAAAGGALAGLAVLRIVSAHRRAT
jgi:hypothetical protein